MQRDLSKYIGRSYNICNCFDLVKEMYKQELNLELQNYFEGDAPSRKEIECLVKTNIGDFSRVPKPEFGDIVVIRLFGYSSHIGFCVDGSTFIHSVRGTGSCVARFGYYSRMIEGFYRHQERSSD